MVAHGGTPKILLMSLRGIRMVSSTSSEAGMETRSSTICFSAFAQAQSERGRRPWATEQNNILAISDLKAPEQLFMDARKTFSNGSGMICSLIRMITSRCRRPATRLRIPNPCHSGSGLC